MANSMVFERFKRLGVWLLFFISVTGFGSCGGSSKEGDGEKSQNEANQVYLGFTPLPFSLSQASLDDVYLKIKTDANLVAHHFDEGIPWNEALADVFPYHSHIMEDWERRKANTPRGHKIYLAVTPINFERTGLALYRGASDNMPLVRPFDSHGASKAFDHEDVKMAYLHYCKRAVRFFQPDFFAMGIEVNLLRKNDPAAFDRYLDLLRFVYQGLKSEFSSLPVFVSVAGVPLLLGYEEPPAEFKSSPDPAMAYVESQRKALERLLVYSDLYALSFYPYATVYYQSPFPADMIPTLFDLSKKPLAVAETGILAEDLTVFGITLIGSEKRQEDYFRQLFSEAEIRKARFIVNFVPVDYDQLCIDLGGCSDLQRIWIKTGFYDKNVRPRSVLNFWRSKL